jgi:hypothetical protein
MRGDALGNRGLPRVFTRHDLRAAEEAVAVGVIAVVVRIDDTRKGLARRLLGSGLERLRVDRRTKRVDASSPSGPTMTPALLRLALSIPGPPACV